MYINII